MSTAELGLPHRFLPPRSAAQSPPLLILAGSSSAEGQLLELAHTLAPGTAILVVHGERRVSSRQASHAIEQDALRHRTYDLATSLGLAASAYGFDAQPLVAIASDDGATVATQLLLLHQPLMAAAMLLRPTLLLTPDEPPFLTGKPVLSRGGAPQSTRRAPSVVFLLCVSAPAVAHSVCAQRERGWRRTSAAAHPRSRDEGVPAQGELRRHRAKKD